jgi:hypothetical protein
MRRLFASRGTAAAFVGALALLVAGGGYALASGTASTIHACIHHKGGDLYIANTCATHDKQISWNKVGPRGPQGLKGKTGATGPQGPGATSVDFNTTGSASPTLKTLGHTGPLTATGTCTTTGSGAGATTQFVVGYTGPAVHVDGSIIEPDGSAVPYSVSTPATSTGHLGTLQATTGQNTEFAQLFVMPSGHAPVELTITAAADGGSPDTGATPDTCHFSAVITPVAAPAG